MPALAAAPTCHAASDVAAVNAAVDFFTMALLLPPFNVAGFRQWEPGFEITWAGATWSRPRPRPSYRVRERLAPVTVWLECWTGAVSS